MSRQSVIQILLIVGDPRHRVAAARRLRPAHPGAAPARAARSCSASSSTRSSTRARRGPTSPRRSGIGRGADLILYGLVVAFFGFVVTTYKRFRAMETRYTRLARRIALDEARPAAEHVKSTGSADTLSGEVPPSPSVKAADAD